MPLPFVFIYTRMLFAVVFAYAASLHLECSMHDQVLRGLNCGICAWKLQHASFFYNENGKSTGTPTFNTANNVNNDIDNDSNKNSDSYCTASTALELSDGGIIPSSSRANENSLRPARLYGNGATECRQEGAFDTRRDFVFAGEYHTCTDALSLYARVQMFGCSFLFFFLWLFVSRNLNMYVQYRHNKAIFWVAQRPHLGFTSVRSVDMHFYAITVLLACIDTRSQLRPQRSLHPFHTFRKNKYCVEEAFVREANCGDAKSGEQCWELVFVN